MNKTELVEAIRNRGGSADMTTRRLELQQQLQQMLNEEAGVEVGGTGSARAETDYQRYTNEMNRASGRKKDLVEFMEKRLGLRATENATMTQLTNQAMAKIYDLSVAHETDPLGFGKYGSLSYMEVLREHPEYCKWVQETSQEGEANPRLHRLAQWLSRTNTSRTTPTTATSAPSWKSAKAKVGYQKTEMSSGRTHETTSSATGSSTSPAVMQEMMAAIQALRSEVAELQSEKRGSRPRRENHPDYEMSSDEPSNDPHSPQLSSAPVQLKYTSRHSNFRN